MRKPTPLKLAIVASGLRQKDIAETIGMDEASLSRIVNGLHADEPTRAKLAAAVGRTPDELWPSDEQAAA